jgi:hypothetical protein
MQTSLLSAAAAESTPIHLSLKWWGSNYLDQRCVVRSGATAGNSCLCESGQPTVPGVRNYGAAQSRCKCHERKTSFGGEFQR